MKSVVCVQLRQHQSGAREILIDVILVILARTLDTSDFLAC
jgi:hypothetical protein